MIYYKESWLYQGAVVFKKIYHRFLKRTPSTLKKLTVIQKHAHQGHPDAQYTLATWYEKGEHGLPCHLILAYRWYQRAAQQGHAQARDRITFLKAVLRAVDMPDA